ncbi:MAG: DUF2259 domain-containing protein [candidate division WOR-3 bacterium]
MQAKYIPLFIIYTFILPSLLKGGDESSAQIIGFSGDGRAVAFSISGVFDGSGFPYCQIILIDVPENKLIGNPVSVVIEECDVAPESACMRARQQADSLLKCAKIIEGNNGIKLRLKPAGKRNLHEEKFIFTVEGKQYMLHLVECPVEKRVDDEFERYIFTLTLSKEGQEIILHHDEELPADRGLAFHYCIESAYLYNNYIVVVIAVFTPGFEGTDIRQIIVSGRLL